MYEWIKALHVIAFISWMAGMLYLPRLFIYHCDAAPGSPQSETFKVMEQRLLRVIINPAMGFTWILGLWMAWQHSLFTSGWFLLKLALVLALSAVHGFFSASVRRFAEDPDPTSDTIVQAEALPGDTIGRTLQRIGIPLDEVGNNVFLNGEYSALNRPVRPGDRLGVFPDDMQLLYKWYFRKCEERDEPEDPR